MSMIGMMVDATDEEIRRLLSEPDEIEDFLGDREDVADQRVLRLDKTWHALHWLLTGSAEEGAPPLNFIVAGGTEIGDIDVGYGAARAFTSVEVQGIHAALAPITATSLLARYDGHAMRDLYPEGWDRPDERDDNLAYLAQHVDGLKAFIAQAADQRHGVIAYLV